MAAGLNPVWSLSALALLSPFLRVVALGAGITWQTDGATRWRSLQIPEQGKTGFTLLAPAQSGITFTNKLDELSSAANRVLENGSGVATGDVDQDGAPDIFFCSLTGQSALYRNLGGWKFEDITQSAGLGTLKRTCRGAVFADLNGDGWPDLLVSLPGEGVCCYINDGTGRFIDRTVESGLKTTFGSTTLALADVDGNGTIDLYVANYRSDDIRDRSRVDIRRVNGRVEIAPWLRDRVLLTPEGFIEFGEPDQLYLNDGHAHFTPVSWTNGNFLDESGKPLVRPPLDWGLSAAFYDLNGDGLPDLYVCNDYWTPDRIWINQGNARFRALPVTALRHTSENSMGIDFADIDRDGRVDFVVLDMLGRTAGHRKRQALAQTKMQTTVGEFSNRPQLMRNMLFHNRGDGTFEEVADYSGLSASGWSWQPFFLDVDLDGYEDLLIAAGHTRDVQDLDATAAIKRRQHPWPRDLDPKQHQEAYTREMMENARLYPDLQMPIVAFHNRGDLRFDDVTADWGTAGLGVHQGMALADFDGDGDLDFVVNNLNSVAGIFRNETIASRVAVRLKGRPANTAGIGALVRLLGGAVPLQSREMTAGGRYLSGSDFALVFAAGKATEMILEIKWRGGKTTMIRHIKPNRLYEIDENTVGTAGAGNRDAPAGNR